MGRRCFGLAGFFFARAALVACTLILPLATRSVARADTIPAGFLSWDVTQPGTTAQFDIVNETGPNSSGDSTFPVITPVHLTSMLLSVQFSDRSIEQFTMADLTLNPFDGLSFESPTIAIGGANPKPVSASLTGQFSDTSVTLFDGSMINIDPSFSSTLNEAGSTLTDGDLALIVAEVGSSPIQPIQVTPEPATWLLVGSAAILVSLRRLLVIS
jgi:hypothetical protein